jgi:lipid-A-disaccharide synthase
MIIAGEPSGDALAAELVGALRADLIAGLPASEENRQPLRSTLAPRFFGAGGPRMAEAGVELAVDMTGHAVIGFSDVLKNIVKFRRIFLHLKRLALDRLPEAVICVDFSGFNRRFGAAIKRHAGAPKDWFHPWSPKLVQFVSPQVWASRAGRAESMQRDFDLLLSIFPFEKAWYARHAPRLKVEFVGHPMLDRYAGLPRMASRHPAEELLLLPGSRKAELVRHLPPMLGAVDAIRRALPGLRFRMVLPSAELIDLARGFGLPDWIQLQLGDLPRAMAGADVALASTGTVTMECAFFGVPTVALYRTSRSTYEIGRRVVKVKYLSMPNLLADAPIMPEFIQDEARAENLAGASLELLRDGALREEKRNQLAAVISSLGAGGAIPRASRAICEVMEGLSHSETSARLGPASLAGP